MTGAWEQIRLTGKPLSARITKLTHNRIQRTQPAVFRAGAGPRGGIGKPQKLFSGGVSRTIAAAHVIVFYRSSP